MGDMFEVVLYFDICGWGGMSGGRGIVLVEGRGPEEVDGRDPVAVDGLCTDD